MAALSLAGLVGLQPAGQPPAAAATVAPFDQLPTGPAPTTVPYAIGQHVYYGGRSYDLSTKMGTAKEFVRVLAPRAGTVFTQTYAGTGGQLTSTLSAFGPNLPFRQLDRRTTTSTPLYAVTSGTSGGLVSQVGPVTAFSNQGRYAGFPYPTPYTGAPCADMPLLCERVEAVGPKFFVSLKASFGTDHYLWYPGSSAYHLPDSYDALKGPGGWVGSYDPTKADCLRTASANSPLVLRARLCSQVVPLLSADGKRAVVVQAGHVRVYDTVTGQQTGVAQLPTFTSWTATRMVKPLGWETSDSYLLTAQYDSALALVRCSVSTNRCQRVVRSSVRTGVTAIVASDEINLPGGLA